MLNDQLKDKQILIVANSGWNIFNFRLHLIRKLLSLGAKVIVLVPKDNYSDQWKTYNGLTTIYLKNLFNKSLNPIKELRLFFELCQHYQNLAPDLILHFTIKPNIFGGLAARWTKKNYLGIITGLGYSFIKGGLLTRVVTFLFITALAKAKTVVFQNNDDKQLFIEKGLKATTQLIRGSGVDLLRFKANPMPKREPFTFIFVGRLLRDKGVLELLEALNQLTNAGYIFNCLIIGGLNEQNPAALTEKDFSLYQNNPNIQWIGKVEDVSPFLAQSHVMVLPSYREGMPRAILEALAMGKVIITTDVPGCRDTVVPNKNGWLVDVKSSKALTDAMEFCMTLPEAQLEGMGAYSRHLAEDIFDIEKINEQFLELIDRSLYALPPTLY